MAIDDTNSVDALGIEPGTGHALMIIVDDMDWSDPVAHINTLQQKITAYLGFINNGQLDTQLPEGAGRPRKIGVFQQCEPPENILAILEAIGQSLSAMGVEFGYGPLPDGLKQT